MKKKHGGKSGSGMAKSMVQIPLYRNRVEKTAKDKNHKRPDRFTLARFQDEGTSAR